MGTCINGHKALDADAFCGICGAPSASPADAPPVRTTCPSGHINPPGNDFCGACGAILQVERPTPEQASTLPRPSDASPPVTAQRRRRLTVKNILSSMWSDKIGRLFLVVLGLLAVMLVVDEIRRGEDEPEEDVEVEVESTVDEAYFDACTAWGYLRVSTLTPDEHSRYVDEMLTASRLTDDAVFIFHAEYLVLSILDMKEGYDVSEPDQLQSSIDWMDDRCVEVLEEWEE